MYTMFTTAIEGGPANGGNRLVLGAEKISGLDSLRYVRATAEANGSQYAYQCASSYYTDSKAASRLEALYVRGQIRVTNTGDALNVSDLRTATDAELAGLRSIIDALRAAVRT